MSPGPADRAAQRAAAGPAVNEHPTGAVSAEESRSMKRTSILFVAFALVGLAGCKSTSAPPVQKSCCPSPTCGCAKGDCCAALCCVEPELLPMPRVLQPTTAIRTKLVAPPRSGVGLVNDAPRSSARICP